MTAAEAESAREEVNAVLPRSDGTACGGRNPVAIHPHGIGTIEFSECLFLGLASERSDCARGSLDQTRHAGIVENNRPQQWCDNDLFCRRRGGHGLVNLVGSFAAPAQATSLKSAQKLPISEPR